MQTVIFNYQFARLISWASILTNMQYFCHLLLSGTQETTAKPLLTKTYRLWVIPFINVWDNWCFILIPKTLKHITTKINYTNVSLVNCWELHPFSPNPQKGYKEYSYARARFSLGESDENAKHMKVGVFLVQNLPPFFYYTFSITGKTVSSTIFNTDC